MDKSKKDSCLLINKEIHNRLKMYCSMTGATLKDIAELALSDFLEVKNKEMQEYLIKNQIKKGNKNQ